MEKNSEMPINRWVDECLTTLCPDSEWEPNAIMGLAHLQERLRNGSGRGKRWLWVIAAAAGTYVCLMALPASRAVAQRCLNYCSNELWPSHATSDPIRANAKLEKDQTGDAAILDIPLKDLQGHDVTVGQYKGQVVLVNFWATWCSPCLAEMPWLLDFQQKYGPKGFTVLGVSLDADGKKSVLPFIESHRFDVNHEKQALDYPILLGSNETGEEFGGIIGLPTSMLFSREGKKVKTVVGIMSRDDVEKAIQGLL
jgi:thiol-disulfide isomerase/thioredoxin